MAVLGHQVKALLGRICSLPFPSPAGALRRTVPVFLEQDVSPQGCLLFPRMQFQRWDMGGYGGLLFTVHWYCVRSWSYRQALAVWH